MGQSLNTCAGQECKPNCRSGRTMSADDAANVEDFLVFSSPAKSVKPVKAGARKPQANVGDAGNTGDSPEPEATDVIDMSGLELPRAAEKIDEAEWQIMLDNAQSLVGVSVGTSAAEGSTSPGRIRAPSKPYFEEFPPEEFPADPNGEDMGFEEEEEPFISEEEQEEFDMLLAVQQDARPLYQVPEHLRCVKDIVLAAIRNEGAYCFDYITSHSLRTCDKDVVMALVFSDGMMLREASDELRSDRDVVRAALCTCAGSLGFPAPHLQADPQLRNLAASREREEFKLMKAFQDKCGPPVTACLSMGRRW